MEKEIILTGDRPTGKLHLGHLLGSLENRVKYQGIYQQYIMIADMQALTDNANNPEKVYTNISEVLLDYLAVGIDPDKSTIFLQSQLPELAELTMYYMNLVTLARLKRNPTVKDEMLQKSYGDNVPIGFLVYPISQAADITAFKATLVPVGIDQLPVIEQTNEIVHKFNELYGHILKEAKPVLAPLSRLIGIDGKNKMSKSLNNAIFLSDESDVVYKKIMSMYTDSNHLKITDSGKIEGNTVFNYLDIFMHDKKMLDSLKEHYQRGGLGDVKLKKYLIDLIEDILTPIRIKRKDFLNNKDYLLQVLKDGTIKAQTVTKVTLSEVKNAIGNHFF